MIRLNPRVIQTRSETWFCYRLSEKNPLLRSGSSRDETTEKRFSGKRSKGLITRNQKFRWVRRCKHLRPQCVTDVSQPGSSKSRRLHW